MSNSYHHDEPDDAVQPYVVPQLDSDSMPALLQKLGELHRLATVAYVHFLRRNAGVRVVYALDFDIFFPMFRPWSVDARHTRATHYMLERLKGPYAIPLGCLHELASYIEDACRRTAGFRSMACDLDMDADTAGAIQLLLTCFSSESRTKRTVALLAGSGDSPATATADVARSIVDMARPYTEGLETLADFLATGEFVGIPSRHILGEDELRSSVTHQLASGRRALASGRNAADAANVSCVLSNNEEYNRELDRRDEHGRGEGLDYFQLVTSTSKLLGLSVPAARTDDRLLREMGEQAWHGTGADWVMTPWDALFLSTSAAPFVAVRSNLAAASAARTAISTAGEALRAWRDGRPASLDRATRVLPLQRLRAYVEALKLSDDLTSRELSQLGEFLAPYLDNSAIRELSEILELDQAEEEEKDHFRAQDERDEPPPSLRHEAIRAAAASEKLLNVVRRLAEDMGVAGAEEAVTPDGEAGSAVGPVMQVLAEAGRVPDGSSAERRTIRFQVLPLERPQDVAILDRYEGYYVVHWPTNALLDQFCSTLGQLLDLSLERPGEKPEVVTVWTPAGVVQIDRLIVTGDGIRSELSRLVQEKNLRVPIHVRIETRMGDFLFDVQADASTGRRHAAVISHLPLPTEIAALILSTSTSLCAYGQLQECLATELR